MVGGAMTRKKSYPLFAKPPLRITENLFIFPNNCPIFQKNYPRWEGVRPFRRGCTNLGGGDVGISPPILGDPVLGPILSILILIYR